MDKRRPMFRAKIEGSIIRVWAVGKWRPIRHYSPKGRIPSETIQKEVLHSIWLNTGKRFDLEKAYLEWPTITGTYVDTYV